MNPKSASVHQQATASGSSNPQQPASPNVMNPWQSVNIGNCKKLPERSLRRLAMCRPKNKKNSCLRDKISVITLKEKPGEFFKVNAWLREDFLQMNFMLRKKNFPR